MTTTVKIEAHCDDDTEVRVYVSGEPDRILQHGESAEVYAHGDRVITVHERPKA